MNRIILAGGGTAGHITPNLALIPHLNKFEIHYCGEAGGMEEKMIAAYPQVTFHALPCIKFRRSLSPENFKIPFVLRRGVSLAKKLIRELSPDVVFSKGGYAALPVALAANKLHVPLVIHESDRSMGLCNRLAAKKCRYVCTSFPELVAEYPNGFYTGTPLRGELFRGNADAVTKKFGFVRSNKPHLLIFGGSLGALAINRATEGAINELCARFDVLHIAGKHAFDGGHLSYRRTEFSDCMADCYAWADYAVCRAGAGTLSEIVALKIPSLVIPLPKSKSSRGDQPENAEYYRLRGAVEVLDQNELTPTSLVKGALSLCAKRSALIDGMIGTGGTDGTKKIADLLNSFMIL